MLHVTTAASPKLEADQKITRLFLISNFRRVLYVVWPSLTRAISLSHTRPRPQCGSLPLYYLLCNRTHPLLRHPSLLLAQAIFEPNLPLATQTIPKFGHLVS